MQKTLDILERNVQWIALGLGGIFLLWAVYSYVVTPPAVAKVGSVLVPPGGMSPKTHDGPAKNVETAMSDNTGIQIAQLNVSQAFDAAMSGGGQTAVASLPAWAIGQSAKLGTSGPTVPGSEKGKALIAALPVLPPAQVVSAQTGLSVVQLPEANNNNNPNANVRNRNNNAVQAAAAQVEDTDWVAAFFKVSADSIKKAFEATLNGQQLTPDVYNTTVLEVEVERQEAEGMDPSTGQPIWPKDNNKFEVVPALKMYRQDMKPMPTETAPNNQKYEYWDWAEKNPQLIYTPDFYQVTGGTPPPDLAAIYGDANANNNSNNATGATDSGAQDNSAQPAATQGTTQPAAPAGQQSSTPSTAGRSLAAANPNYFYAPEDNNPRSESYYRSRYNRGGYGRPFPGRGAPERFPRSFQAPGQNQNFAGDGKLDPLNLGDDLRIWAYDDTAKPGQTYRYRIVYKLRNPVFGTANMADPKVASKFALVSPPSDWTGPVTVPEKTKFWLATLGANKANLDIFNFDKGQWKATHQTLTPGDQVPGTDWTLVDVRGSEGRERDRYVLLTSDTGQMSKRDLNTDRNDPTYQDLKNQTNPNNGENGAGPGTGNVPPPNLPSRRNAIPPSRGGGYRGR